MFIYDLGFVLLCLIFAVTVCRAICTFLDKRFDHYGFFPLFLSFFYFVPSCVFLSMFWPERNSTPTDLTDRGKICFRLFVYLPSIWATFIWPSFFIRDFTYLTQIKPGLLWFLLPLITGLACFGLQFAPEEPELRNVPGEPTQRAKAFLPLIGFFFQEMAMVMFWSYHKSNSWCYICRTDEKSPHRHQDRRISIDVLALLASIFMVIFTVDPYFLELTFSCCRVFHVALLDVRAILERVGGNTWLSSLKSSASALSGRDQQQSSSTTELVERVQV